MPMALQSRTLQSIVEKRRRTDQHIAGRKTSQRRLARIPLHRPGHLCISSRLDRLYTNERTND